MKWFWCPLVVFVLIFAETASAQFYRYVDRQGAVKYTDDINQVPEIQRARIRSYAGSESPAADVKESSEKVEKNTSSGTVSAGASGTTAMAAEPGNSESLESTKTRLEATKKQLDAEYQALFKDKEALAGEKDKLKTREQIEAHNQRVEDFNRRAGKYETESTLLRNQVDEYNARVTEENDKLLKK